MRLAEVVKMTGSKIRTTKTTSGDTCMSLERVEVKEGCILRGATGFGENKREARKALAAAVSGERLVRNAYSTDRQEFDLTGIKVSA